MDDDMETKMKLVKKYSSLIKSADVRGVSMDGIRSIVLDHLNNDNLETDIPKGQQRTGRDQGSDGKKGTTSKRRCLKRYTFAIIFVIGVISSVVVYYYKDSLRDLSEINSSQCLLEANEFSIEMSRPLAQCGFCEKLEDVPIEYDISDQDFTRKYAYSLVPVLIKGATFNWSAMTNFSFGFFKDLYTGLEGALASVEEDCQFFQYNTDFATLGDVFNMSNARATFSEGETPWYVGWSNCHNDVKKELRNHYQRPYFLPNDSESSTLDWIFMGGSGPGALIHLDYVQRPSWQAQISGMKTWTLIPPPECEAECKSFNVTVHKGDIIVIDTNIWYHSTFVHPGEISICIGSEYD